MTYDELIEEYGDYMAEMGETIEDGGAYVLIERSTYSGDYWLTRHATPQAAIDYHAEQECPEDWEPVRMVNVVTGDDFEGVLTPTQPQTFTFFQGGC